MNSNAKTTTVFQITGDVTAKMTVEIIQMKKTAVSNFYLMSCFELYSLFNKKEDFFNTYKNTSTPHVLLKLHLILKMNWHESKIVIPKCLWLELFSLRSVAHCKHIMNTWGNIISSGVLDKLQGLLLSHITEVWFICFYCLRVEYVSDYKSTKFTEHVPKKTGTCQ